jgi:hypothetical protein
MLGAAEVAEAEVVVVAEVRGRSGPAVVWPVAGKRMTLSASRRNPTLTRLKVLVFGVVVVAVLIVLGVGWVTGRRVWRECEAIARERQATGERQYDVKDCLAARLLSGGA